MIDFLAVLAMILWAVAFSAVRSGWELVHG
jgi:hypothetical protein